MLCICRLLTLHVNFAFSQERNTFIKKVDLARDAEREAEKEADNAVTQLESFVKQHEETVCIHLYSFYD